MVVLGILYFIPTSQPPQKMSSADGVEKTLLDDVLEGNISIRRCLLWIFGSDEEVYTRLMGHTFQKIDMLDSFKCCNSEINFSHAYS